MLRLFKKSENNLIVPICCKPSSLSSIVVTIDYNGRRILPKDGSAPCKTSFIRYQYGRGKDDDASYRR